MQRVRMRRSIALWLSARDRSGKEDNGLGYNLGGWGLGKVGGSFGTSSASTSSNYIGTFVVGLYDPAAKELVWTGAPNMLLNPARNRRKTSKDSIRERQHC